MKLTMQMTLDGLVRALRLKAHALAEEIEAGYADGAYGADRGAPERGATAPRLPSREQDDARAGR